MHTYAVPEWLHVDDVDPVFTTPVRDPCLFFAPKRTRYLRSQPFDFNASTPGIRQPSSTSLRRIRANSCMPVARRFPSCNRQTPLHPPNSLVLTLHSDTIPSVAHPPLHPTAPTLPHSLPQPQTSALAKGLHIYQQPRIIPTTPQAQYQLPIQPRRTRNSLEHRLAMQAAPRTLRPAFRHQHASMVQR